MSPRHPNHARPVTNHGYQDFRLGPRQAAGAIRAPSLRCAASDVAGLAPPARPGSLGDDTRSTPFDAHCARPRGRTGTSPRHPPRARPVTNHGYQDFRLGPCQAQYARPVSGARPPTTPGLRLQRVRAPWGTIPTPRPLMHTVRARGGGRGRAPPPSPRPAGDESRVPGFSARPSPGAIRAPSLRCAASDDAGLAPPARPGSMGDDTRSTPVESHVVPARR